ncbi:hypothetical protein Tco_0195775 [Tanacetum coccineum]
MELQLMQLKERELHQTWLARFTKLKTRLEFLHNNRFTVGSIIEQYETAFRILFQEECLTFRLKIHQNLNQLQWQLERKIPHSSPTKSCLKVLRTPFKEFFDSKEVTASDFHNKGWQKHFTDYMGWKLEAYRHILLCEIQQQESLVIKGTILKACLVIEGATIEACLVTEGATLEACLVNEGIAVNDNTCVTESSRIESENSSSTTPLCRSEDENRGSDKDRSSSMNECNRSGNENKSSDHESTSSGNDANADIGPSYDSNTMTELERYKEKEKYFAKDMTNESEYCKKIKLLNDEISNLKSQACEKDKTFAKENEKLQKAGQTGQTLRILLPKEDNINTGKQGLGFENQNDDIISEEELKCKAEKRLKVKQRKSPLSYYGFVYAETQFEEPQKVPLKRRNVNLKKHLEQTHNLKEHLEQAQLKDIDPKLWNSLPMKYICYVKQAMIKFEKQTFSKLQLNQDELFIMDFEQSINMRVRNRWSDEFEPLVKNVNLQLNCFEMSLVKEMKDDLKYVISLEDEFDETCLILDIQQEFFKTQFESLEAQSIAFEIALQHKIQENNYLKTMQTENENFAASLQNKNAHFKQTYKDLFETIQSTRVETNPCDDVKLKFDFDEIETQNIELEHKVASLIKENEHLKLVYKNLFDSVKMLRVLEMTLAKQTKDFEDAKVDFSKKTDKFETYFEKLEKTKVILERQLDRKIQDSNTEKDQFLKQIASFESKLA